MNRTVFILLFCLTYAYGSKLFLDQAENSSANSSNDEFHTKPPPKNHNLTLINHDKDKQSIGHHYNASKKLPSIRLYPHRLHLCTGTFISRKTILTTARCIFGQPVERLFIHATKMDHGNPIGVIIDVRKTYTHPHFEMSPKTANVGVVHLKKMFKWATVFELPTHRFPDGPGWAYMYGWKFTDHRDKFFQFEMKVRIFSRAKCSMLLHEYVDCDTICAQGADFEHGIYDEGTPLALKFSNRSSLSLHHRRVEEIIAIYEGVGGIRKVIAEKYASVFPYVNWIKKHM